MAAFLVYVVSFGYTIVDSSLSGCSLFGAPPNLTLSAIMIVALVGWAFAFNQVLPTLMNAVLRPGLVGRAAASDADIIDGLRSASSIQNLCKQIGPTSFSRAH